MNIKTRSAAIARADSCRNVAPSHVIRACIEAGAGRPGRPLTAELQGHRACGQVLRAGEWAQAIDAMLAAGALYTSGGRWVYVER